MSDYDDKLESWLLHQEFPGLEDCEITEYLLYDTINRSLENRMYKELVKIFDGYVAASALCTSNASYIEYDEYGTPTCKFDFSNFNRYSHFYKADAFHIEDSVTLPENFKSNLYDANGHKRRFYFDRRYFNQSPSSHWYEINDCAWRIKKGLEAYTLHYLSIPLRADSDFFLQVSTFDPFLEKNHRLAMFGEDNSVYYIGAIQSQHFDPVTYLHHVDASQPSPTLYIEILLLEHLAELAETLEKKLGEFVNEVFAEGAYDSELDELGLFLNWTRYVSFYTKRQRNDDFSTTLKRKELNDVSWNDPSYDMIFNDRYKEDAYWHIYKEVAPE